MKYIDHLTNFAIASLAAGLGPNEVTLYMRLFWKANELFWPEYIEYSLPDLKLATNMKSVNTIKKARRILVEKGFIQFSEIKGKRTLYSISNLQEYQKITPTLSNIDTHPVKICHPVYQKMTPTLSNIDTPTPCEVPDNGACGGLQDYKTNKTNKTYISDSDKSSDLSRVVEAFTQKIAPSISPLNYEKLADDVKRYGASRVLKAIDRAEQDNKLSLGWVEYLLKNNLEGGKQQYGSKKCSGSAGGNSSADSPTEDDLAYLDVYMQQGPFPWDEGQ